jgi:hypothetical protein
MERLIKNNKLSFFLKKKNIFVLHHNIFIKLLSILFMTIYLLIYYELNF